MCGIIGYSGEENVVPVLLHGLDTLAYRGYDSSGIAVGTAAGVEIVKAEGKLDRLVAKLEGSTLFGTVGIGHTRWATHGAPSDKNSHPHGTGRLTLVHNGIIENYRALSESFVEQGYVFASETDTEAAAFCLDALYKECGDPVETLFRGAEILKGSFAFGVLFHDRPGKLYAIRRDSPLIVAKTENGSFIASDIPAILSYTRCYTRLPESVVAVLDGASVAFYSAPGQPMEIPEERVDWDMEAAKKGGYPHFMLKE